MLGGFMKKLFILTVMLASLQLNASNAYNPFIILRMMPSACLDREFANQTIQHSTSKAFDDVWLCSLCNFASKDDVEKDAVYIDALAADFEKKGISASYQLGVTLNHGDNVKNSYGLQTQDFRINAFGKKTPYLCETSERVKEYFYMRTFSLLKNSRIKSFWLDDDFRIALNLTETCYCDRCITLFNQNQKEKTWDRQQLYQTIISGTPQGNALLAQWLDFHNTKLSELAQVVKKARDDANPKCFLGLQTIDSFKYTRHNIPKIVKGFTGENGKVGVRLGSGYYHEFNDDELITKLLTVMFDADRCSREKQITKICYEAENWPHIATKKTPRAMMLECALMMAAGCDGLSLYFHTPEFKEPFESYARFVDTVTNWRPYFEALRDSTRKTYGYGITRAIATAPELKKTGNVVLCQSPVDETEKFLIRFGFPIFSGENKFSVTLLTRAEANRMTNDEIKKILSTNVIMDCHMINYLKSRGFDLKVNVKNGNKNLVSTGIFTANAYENCRGERYDIRGNFFVLSGDIEKSIVDIKTTNGDSLGCAMGIVKTPFGGKAFVVGGTNFGGFGGFPTEYRRTALLDGIDALAPMPVRLETSHCAMFIPRVNEKGEFASGTIFNFSRGETDKIKLRIRSNTSKTYELLLPPSPFAGKQKFERRQFASEKAKDGDGYILTLPAVPPVSVISLKLIEK